MGMRILHVVGSLEPQAGSVAVLLPGLFAALEARGIESRVVTAAGAGRPSQEDPRPKDPRIAGYDEADPSALVRDADVVHLHGWNGAPARAMAALARKLGRRYVISPLGDLAEQGLERTTWRQRIGKAITQKQLVRRAAAITAVNDTEERDLAGRRVHSRIRPLPYGLDMSEYETPPDADGEGNGSQGRAILLMAPMHPVEGHALLLKALAELGLDDGDWRVIVAGPSPGDWRAKLEAAVRRKGESDRVTFTAAEGIGAQRTLLARSAILAAPTMHVRVPTAVLQAAAANVPIVATDNIAPAGLEGVLRTSKSGRSAFREALRSVMALSDAERIAIAHKARERARAMYDWPVLVDTFVRLYEDVA